MYHKSSYWWKYYIYIQGGGAGPPLELGIYRVKFLKIHKISFFLLLGPPLGKNRSSTPEHCNTRSKTDFSTVKLGFSYLVSQINQVNINHFYCKKYIGISLIFINISGVLQQAHTQMSSASGGSSSSTTSSIHPNYGFDHVEICLDDAIEVQSPDINRSNPCCLFCKSKKCTNFKWKLKATFGGLTER